MGHIYTQVEFTGTKKKAKLSHILVDTGATYTVVDPSIVKSIGASKIPGKIKIELGDGKKVLAHAYAAQVKINGHRGPAVIITFKNAKNVIGVETLETLGLSADVKKRKLKSTRPPGVAFFYCNRV